MTSFTFRLMKRYRAQITFELAERLFPNAEIASKIGKLGFSDVTVSAEGRTLTIEGTWDLHDGKMSLKEIPITIDGSKSKFSLAPLLQGLGNAKEIQPPKQIPSRECTHRKTNNRRKRRKS
jgi:hypothetical protein